MYFADNGKNFVDRASWGFCSIQATAHMRTNLADNRKVGIPAECM